MEGGPSRFARVNSWRAFLASTTALSGSDWRLATPMRALSPPLTTLPARGTPAESAAAVVALAKEYDVDAFVLGLPLNMDDTEGKQAKITRSFGAELTRLTALTVHYFDERLSSFAAEELLLPAELTPQEEEGPPGPRSRPGHLAELSRPIHTRVIDLHRKCQCLPRSLRNGRVARGRPYVIGSPTCRQHRLA